MLKRNERKSYAICQLRNIPGIPAFLLRLKRSMRDFVKNLINFIESEFKSKAINAR